MKGLILQIMSILMAFLLLFSTLSFKVDMHFCGNHLVDLSLTRKAATCGMISSPEIPGGCMMAAMNCCTDVEIVLVGQHDLRIVFNSFDLNSTYSPFSAIPEFHLRLPPQTPVHQPEHFREYSPPLIIRPVHLLNQTFLI